MVCYRRFHPAASRASFLAVAILAVYLSSCGNGWKKCYPARGKILLDGQPLAGAEVWLLPTSGELLHTNPPVRPFAKTEADGTFTLTTYVVGDGAPLGTYKARVICERRVRATQPRAAGDDDNDGPGLRNILPSKYADPETSGLSVTIQAGENLLPDFNLKK